MLVDRLGAGFDRGGAGQAEHAQHLYWPVGDLRGGGRPLRQDGAGSGDGVGFAVAAAGGAVWPVDLDRTDLVAA
jgi:hypothetical protein